MPISAGLYKKVTPWLKSENGNNVAFRPFLTKGNPYKSRIFLVSLNAIPYFKVEDENEQKFAEALVNRELFQEIYFNEIMTAPREFKGSLQFEKWLEKQHNESLIHTSLNTYQLETADQAKVAKKEDTANFEQGHAIFKEVLEEFQPKIIILQGAATLNQFKTMYADQLVSYHPDVTKVQELEEIGPFGELHYENGEKVSVFVTRSMSFFGVDGLKFEHFKQNLEKML